MQVSSPKLVEQRISGNISQIRYFLKGGKTEESHLIDKLSDAELERELKRISQLKRFYERWQADPDFRQEFLTNPHQAVSRYNMNIDSEEISLLWNDALAQKDTTDLTPISVKRYREFYRGVKCDMSDIAGSSTDSRFKAWRERQMARCSSQMCKSLYDEILHMTACFELSKGCSVGCWFCGISAPRLGDIFTYNKENAKLWREVLELLRDIHGPAAKAGFCYWATDPLDNPNYEKFCSDFHELLGIFPQTTTAQALRDPTRTRSLLKLSLSKGCIVNRFSILSLKMLDQLYKEFSPEELTFVRLVLQNPEVGIIKANSGRAREHNKRKAEKNHEVLDDSLPGTNACVSGFLFNMVERSVKLISPCNADERWPNGYRVYEEGAFTNVDDLKILLEGMIDRHMPLTVRPNERLSFRRDFRYESLPDGFQLSTRFKTHKFRNDPYIKQLGEVIHKGDKTAEEIVSLFNICGIPSAYIFQSLNLMFKEGVLDDEPNSRNL
jgi:radical SAM family RiPP maturation amino acid epimerase